MDLLVFNHKSLPTKSQKEEVVEFLFDSLEQYGDPKRDIAKAIDYSIQEFQSFGGFTLVLSEVGRIKGAVVMNRTGMNGYIPENTLVYIAIHKNHRGEGLGKRLMKEAISLTQGDIALHVETENPAKGLYEKLGFENPYLEMRLKKQKNG